MAMVLAVLLSRAKVRLGRNQGQALGLTASKAADSRKATLYRRHSLVMMILGTMAGMKRGGRLGCMIQDDGLHVLMIFPKTYIVLIKSFQKLRTRSTTLEYHDL